MNPNQDMSSVESRILGRVFSYDDQLHFVVGVDEASGLARCMQRGRRGVAEILMPVVEITLRLGWEQERQEREQIDRLSYRCDQPKCPYQIQKTRIDPPAA